MARFMSIQASICSNAQPVQQREFSFPFRIDALIRNQIGNSVMGIFSRFRVSPFEAPDQIFPGRGEISGDGLEMTAILVLPSAITETIELGDRFFAGSSR